MAQENFCDIIDLVGMYSMDMRKLLGDFRQNIERRVARNQFRTIQHQGLTLSMSAPLGQLSFISLVSAPETTNIDQLQNFYTEK
jgi:hypothetical protein